MTIQLNIREKASFAFETGKGLLKKHELAYQFLMLSHNLLFGAQRKVPAYLIEGTVRGTNLTTKALYVGGEDSSHQFASRVCSQPFKIVRKEQFPFRCAASFSRASSAEIIAIRIERPFASRYSERGFLLLPNVRFVLDLRRSMHEIIRRMDEGRRRDLKKIEKSRYTYTVHRQDREVFRFFYGKMYLPYVTKRFDKVANIKTFLESRIAYSLNGGIVMVRKEGQPHAGILFQVQGKKLLVNSLGVYEGNQELVRAMGAALFHLIGWAKAKGVELLDYGVCTPFLKDGLFIYKKEWGMSVKDATDQSFCALRFNSLTDGSLAFLRQNPFVIYDRGFIKGLVLLEKSPNKDELRHLFARYYLPELASLIVVSYYHDSTTSLHDKIDSQTSSDSIRGLGTLLQNVCERLQERGYRTRLIELRSMP